MKANINGQQVAVQFEKRNGQLLHLRHYGNKVYLLMWSCGVVLCTGFVAVVVLQYCVVVLLLYFSIV